MINNRQGGRRRGRGGGQRQGGGGQGQRDSGNRIDSRARGNAAQLLEKYRNMARDAQMSGDRVQTEYYLQFADHYFRVLADQRGRSDEQPQRGRQRDDFDQFDDADDFGDEGDPIRADEQPRVSEEAPARRDEARRDESYANGGNANGGNDRERDRDRDRPRRNDRADRAPREPRAATPANDVVAEAADAGEEAPRRRTRTRRPREDAPLEGQREEAAVATEEVASIAIDRLPPALTTVASDDESPRPRRRRVRAASTDEVPTAAE